GFLAARVVDARARAAVRVAPGQNAARPLHAVASSRGNFSGVDAVMITLTDDAWCVIPRHHAAHRSADAARELVNALAAALRLDHTR
ncbi:MAG TPA: hypothetical protein VI259_18170, partial [Gemmatimonadaceae bacterium]